MPPKLVAIETRCKSLEDLARAITSCWEFRGRHHGVVWMIWEEKILNAGSSWANSLYLVNSSPVKDKCMVAVQGKCVNLNQKIGLVLLLNYDSHVQNSYCYKNYS